MKVTIAVAAFLALAASASASVIPSVRQAPPCVPQPPTWTPTLPPQPTAPWQPTPPAPWQPTPPAPWQPTPPAPWQPAPPAPWQPTPPAPWQPPAPTMATLVDEEGIVTATAGEKTCVLTEALPEGESLPPYAQVTEQWGAEYAVMQTLPIGKMYSCKLEVAAGDRR